MATDITVKDLTSVIIAEGDTPSISFQLVDENAAGVPVGQITSATLTVYEQSSKTIVNSQNVTDIKNANNGTIDGSGNVLYTLATGDSTIINARTRENQKECHVFQFKFNYATDKYKTVEVILAIKNIVAATL